MSLSAARDFTSKKHRAAVTVMVFAGMAKPNALREPELFAIAAVGWHITLRTIAFTKALSAALETAVHAIQANAARVNSAQGAQEFLH